jgi:hypothetical protein
MATLFWRKMYLKEQGEVVDCAEADATLVLLLVGWLVGQSEEEEEEEEEDKEEEKEEKEEEETRTE